MSITPLYSATMNTGHAGRAGTVLVAVRLPEPMRQAAVEVLKKEDITMSQLIRRAIRHEIHGAIDPRTDCNVASVRFAGV